MFAPTPISLLTPWSIMSEQANRESEEEDSDYVQGENRSIRRE